ncbi:MAG: bacillithiol biosynthesis cysteine-adding enzyme BshC [Flavobacteriales bacterium]
MINKISFKESRVLSKLSMDYLENPELFAPFISEIPNLNNFEKQLNKRKPIDRELLYYSLLSQNKDCHSNSLKNIELLRKKNTFTVTTGHQIGLFTGPLYSIYKIISTLNLAKALKKKYSNYNFVPIFWMATEDHDFEEINHVYLKDQKVTWNSNQKGPVGRFLTKNMIPFLDEIKKIVSSDFAKTLIEFYSSTTNLAEAHRKMVNYIFGEEGIVIIDADSRELKKEMIPIFKNELLTNNTFDAVENLSEELVKKGFKKQVNPREINLFYQENGLRERIVKTETGFEVVNTDLKFSEEEILNELESCPEKFSPNVVMRPIYEEKILPNLAYIGGPGELAYWLQLKESFKVNKVDFPILVLRNSVLLITEKTKKKMSKLPFAHSEYFEDENDLINSYINEISDISFEEEIKSIEQVFEITKDKAVEVDFSLERTVIAELKRAQNSINKIRKKVTRAEKKNNETAINQIKSVKNSFFPGGSFQERKLNILEFYEPNLIKNLIDNLIILEDNITLMEL